MQNDEQISAVSNAGVDGQVVDNDDYMALSQLAQGR
jgi:hypothetical protein